MRLIALAVGVLTLLFGAGVLAAIGPMWVIVIVCCAAAWFYSAVRRL